jgi:hypothetical protein
MVLYPKVLFELYKKTDIGVFSPFPIVVGSWSDISYRGGVETTKDVITVKYSNDRVNGSYFTSFLGKKSGADNLFGVDDEVKLYGYYSTLPTDKDDALIMSGRITGFDYQESGGKLVYSLKMVNRTEELLNTMVPYSTLADSSAGYQNNTPPKIIKQMIARLNQFQENDKKRYLYAALDNEKIKNGTKEITDTYGNIASVRSKAYKNEETGTITTAFPTIDYNETWKPVYYNIETLSGPDYTSDPDAGGYVYYVKYTPVLTQHQKEFGTTINELVWKPKSQTSGGSLFDSRDFINPHITLDVKDVQNCLIINAGTDFQGAGITGVAYDLESMGKYGIKVGYWTGLRNMFSILQTAEMGSWVKYKSATKDSDGMPIAGDFPNTMTFPERDWMGHPGINPTASDKNDYNDYLRNEARWQAIFRARDILKKLGEPRYGLTADMIVGSNTLVLGNIYEFVVPSYGWEGTANNPGFKIRIKNMSHTFNKNGWTSQFEAEEDEKVVSQAIGNTKNNVG